jgi:hypothetical protein
MCSWDFRVEGATTKPVELNFYYFTEQGSILYGAHFLNVKKHGWLSGRWTLANGCEVLAEANKPNTLFRSFEVHDGRSQFTVEARSPFVRSYVFLSEGLEVGHIEPAHAFTKRSTIECTPEIDELSQLFGFWLAVMTWRRTKRNSPPAS